jgi:parallel beta-helix repeat protein
MQFGSYPLITTVSGDDTLLVLQDSSGAVKQITASDFSAVQQSPQGVINVKWFGAKGDGVTDDTTAIQNAINSATANQAVYFPTSSGSYIVTSQLTIPVNYLTIFGFGAVIQGTGPTQYRFISATTITGLTIFGLTFNGSYSGGATAETLGAIELTTCTGTTIRDCVFLLSPECGIVVNAGYRTNISGNVFDSCYIGIRTNISGGVQADGVRAVNNSFSNLGFGLYLTNASNCTVSGNTISLPGTAFGRGIYIAAASTKISIVGNAISGVGRFGIEVDGDGGAVNDVTISGNSIKSDGACIKTHSSYAITILGNVIATNSANCDMGIWVDGSIGGTNNNHALIIKGNQFKGVFATAIIGLVASAIGDVIADVEVSGNNTSDASSVVQGALYWVALAPARYSRVKVFGNTPDTSTGVNNVLNSEYVTGTVSVLGTLPVINIQALDATGGNLTFTPWSAALHPGSQVTVIKSDASGNTVTIVGTINGAANKVLAAQYKFATVKSNGTDWYIIASN